MNNRTAQVLACVSLLVMLATHPLLLMGIGRSLASMKNAPIHWIPDTFPGIQVFRNFVDRFDSLEVTMVSWDNATVDDPRLERVANELQAWQDARIGPISYSAIAYELLHGRDPSSPALRCCF